MKISKDLTELIDAGVIDQSTAEKISTYYSSKTSTPQNKLVIVFAILGALLVSLGIILILAHNWDDLSRTTRTVIAFLPLIIGQLLCAYTLLKRNDSTAWREASSVFLYFAIGACISLISQIYNTPGNMTVFLLTWLILGLPIVYVMNSSSASLLYIIGITTYACQIGYWESYHMESYLYWGLLVLILPHYYFLYTRRSESNFFTFHNWFIPLSVTIVLGTIAKNAGELMFVSYMSLFGLLYLLGGTKVLRDLKIRDNGYLVLGSLGTVVMLLALGFDWFWSDLRTEKMHEGFFHSPEFISALLITLAALALLIYQKTKQSPITLRPAEWVFIVFIGIFFLGMTSPFVVIWINILTLIVAILTIREGAIKNHLGILNYGLLIITALIICRFFDVNIGFALKGLLFVMVGMGFFFANLWMIRKKKKVVNPS
jgi:uncharacterized membrane protein